MSRLAIIAGGLIWWASIGLALAGEGAPHCTKPLPAVVATVDGEQITRAAVRLRLKSSGLEACRRALDEAIDAVLVRQRAEDYRLRVTPSAVRETVEKFRSEFSEADLAKFLAERDASEADLERMIEDGVFVKTIEERQIRSWVFADDLQEEYFARHRTELVKDRAKVRHILVQTRQEAERIRRDLAIRDRTLADLAGDYSLDANTREQGGDLGWIERGPMTPAFDDMVFSSELGIVSAPVQTPLGWHLIKVEDRKLAADQTIEDHRARVIRLLQEEEWRSQRESWWSELRSPARVWIAPELVPAAEVVHAE